jgi:mono/diheme cytochrome c family protein
MNNKTMKRLIGLLIFVGIILIAFATNGLYGCTQGSKLRTLKPVPVKYVNKHMPDGGWTDQKMIKEGKEIYEQWCAACHGENGIPEIKGVRNLSSARMNRMSDSYWFWRITEGVPNTEMIAWEANITEEDRWKIIAYSHQFSHSGKVEEHKHPEIERK